MPHSSRHEDLGHFRVLLDQDIHCNTAPVSYSDGSLSHRISVPEIVNE